MESKLYAYVNFFLRPRNRTWSRDGVIEHVIIKAPKNPQVQRFVGNRSPDQVRSQLRHLAQVVDTRGWDQKQSSLQVQVYPQPINDDRLITPAATGPRVESDVQDEEDMFDMFANPVAQNIDKLTEQATERSREEAVQHMRQQAPDPNTIQPNPAKKVDPRFMHGTPPIEHHHHSSHKPFVPKNEKTLAASSAAEPRQISPTEDSNKDTPTYRPYPTMRQNKVKINPYENDADKDKSKQKNQAKTKEEKDKQAKLAERLKELGQSGMSVSAIQHQAERLEKKSANEGELTISHDS